MRALIAPVALMLLVLVASATAHEREPTIVDPIDLTISGRVMDAQSGAPVASARVFLRDSSTGVLTGRDGRYTLRILERDRSEETMMITIQHPEFREVSMEIDPTRAGLNGHIDLDVRLERSTVRPGEGVAVGAEADPAANAVAVRTSGLRRSAAFAPTSSTRSGWNREQYAHVEENDFRSVEATPLSTFSIDVDRASYSNIRRFLREGRLPPVDAVQVEEMINYFHYDYELPAGEHPLAVTTELGSAPWAEGHQLLRIGLASPAIDTENLPPNNLVFLLDVSGSMQSPSKLPLVKRSMRLLVEELRPEDRVALVVYAGAAGVVLESTPGSRKEQILDAIGRLEAGGSTAGGAGLQLAYDIARENFLEGGNNRVILATDGDFNVGPSSDSEMIRLIEERREEGTFLTVLGFGSGNIQTSKMQGLAQHGNGNWAYIDSLGEARKFLVSEMGGTLLTVSQDVKLQVEFNPARVRAYRLIGYENRLLADEDFNDDTKDAGELGAGHRVTALYEIVPVGIDSDVEIPQVDPLRYRDRAEVSGSSDDELTFVRLRYKEPRGTESRLMEHLVAAETGTTSDDFRFAAAVAGFGMILRESEHRGTMSPRDVLALAEEGLGRDLEGYRRGFLEMVHAYMAILDGAEHETISR